MPSRGVARGPLPHSPLRLQQRHLGPIMRCKIAAVKAVLDLVGLEVEPARFVLRDPWSMLMDVLLSQLPRHVRQVAHWLSCALSGLAMSWGGQLGFSVSLTFVVRDIN